jgi:stress response protein SCP2
MSVSLTKGQKVNLSKESPNLSRVTVALGWDEAKKKGGFLSSLFSSVSNIDCDASAVLLKNGKLKARQDIVYFGNLKHKSGTVLHQGDNLTGAGDGDDEQIVVDLAKIPAEYDKIVFVVNIYQAVQRKQHFGMIENAYIRIVDGNGNKEICRYNLTESYPDMTGLIFGEIYRHDGEWKFNAIGQGTKDPDVFSLVGRYA